MDIHMSAHRAKLDRERPLWAESRDREMQLVEDVLEPWVKQRIADGIPADEMLEHDSAAELLDAVAQWCRDYTQWREECGLAFVEGYPAEDWAGQVPAERRAAVLFRISHHIHGQGEVERTWHRQCGKGSHYSTRKAPEQTDALWLAALPLGLQAPWGG